MTDTRWPADAPTVHWCFYHARREWSDRACSEAIRWTLPTGLPLRVERVEEPLRVVAGRRRSEQRGVYWHRTHRLWQAKVTVNGRSVYLGGFAEEADAVAAVVRAQATLEHALAAMTGG